MCIHLSYTFDRLDKCLLEDNYQHCLCLSFQKWALCLDCVSLMGSLNWTKNYWNYRKQGWRQYLKFFLIILTGVSLDLQAFQGFSLRDSFKFVSLVTILKEKDIFLFLIIRLYIFLFLFFLGRFSYHFIAF